MGDQLLDTDTTLTSACSPVKNFNAISKFGYLEIDPTPPQAGDEIYIPQHPGGDPTPARDQQRPGQGANCKVASSNFDAMRRAATCRTTATLQVVLPDRRFCPGRPEGDCLHHFGGCPNPGSGSI